MTLINPELNEDTLQIHQDQFILLNLNIYVHYNDLLLVNKKIFPIDNIL